MSFSISEAVKETMKLKMSAVNQLLTENPEIRSSTKRMIRIFITSRNNPNVKTVMGMVSSTSKGLIKVFSNPNTNATRSAVSVLCTSTPFSKKAANKTASEVVMVLIKNLPIKEYG